MCADSVPTARGPEYMRWKTGFLSLKNSARQPRAASRRAVLRTTLGIAQPHLLEHAALAQVEHVEHVARVVEATLPTRSCRGAR